MSANAPAILLREQRAQRARDHVGFVARRHDDVDVRAAAPPGSAGTKAVGTRIPKSTASHDQADPRRRANPRRRTKHIEHRAAATFGYASTARPLRSSARSCATAIARAADALFALQRPAGYWWAELAVERLDHGRSPAAAPRLGRFERVPRAAAERYFRERAARRTAAGSSHTATAAS